MGIVLVDARDSIPRLAICPWGNSAGGFIADYVPVFLPDSAAAGLGFEVACIASVHLNLVFHLCFGVNLY